MRPSSAGEQEGEALVQPKPLCQSIANALCSLPATYDDGVIRCREALLKDARKNVEVNVVGGQGVDYLLIDIFPLVVPPPVE